MVCKELNKEFDNKEELFKALRLNKNKIIESKKSQVLKSCDKNISVKYSNVSLNKITSNKDLFENDNYYYIAVNTTKILDSHSDLHVDGIWNKTVAEQQGKNYLLTDHKMEIANVVAKKDKVHMFVADIPFSAIGKDYAGNTQALIYKVAKNDVRNDLAKEWLDSGDDLEASVRMQYVKIYLAMNSDDKEDRKEKKMYDDYIDTIANKEELGEINYFWVVKEAKNVGESSLVLMGSNSSTGLVNNNKDIEPSENDTHKLEPSDDTRKNKYKTIFY